MKIKAIPKTALIILLIGLIVVPSSNAINYYNSTLKKEILIKYHELNDEDLYRFCYAESGAYSYENVCTTGFFFWGPPGFGIGRVSIDLIGGGVNLKIIKIFRTISYDNDVHVELRGFIGCVYPTVSIYGGILEGRAIIVKVSPLN
jgi:hypothetical protein